jgi:hypothetical protein
MGCFEVVFNDSVKTARIEYRANFDRGEAWETFDWRFDREETRLLGYAVETGFDDGQPDWELVLAPGGARPNATSCTEDDTHWWER